MKIKIISGDIEAIADLNNTKTAKKIFDTLPIEGRALRWGDEIYFYINTKIKKENPKEEVNIGDLGYWIEGGAFCIFFGKTPASTSARPKAASPVNVFGRIISGIGNLKDVKNNSKIQVEKM